MDLIMHQKAVADRGSYRFSLCMLDLDTVMPGIVHFDFGDCIRSAANPAGENEKDLGSINIDMALFEAVTEGYLREARAFLTKTEIAMLPLSVKVITFELGLRFLADSAHPANPWPRTSLPVPRLARGEFPRCKSVVVEN